MTIQIAIVLVLLVLCVALFSIEAIPPDVTALGLVTILRSKTLQFREGKTGLELSGVHPVWKLLDS